MVWKPGQSGNINGRPRAAYHWDGEKIVEHDTTEHKIYKSAKAQGFGGGNGGSAAKRDEYKYSAEALHLEDPILFQHKLLADDALPIGLRVAIAQNIAPYCHPSIGLVSMPRYVETPIDVPEFQSMEEAEAFLLVLSRRTGAGELPLDTASEITAQISAWIHSRRQGMELEIKRLNADATAGEQVIRIVGGLPPLAGCEIIYPELNPSPVIESKADVLSPPADEPAEPAE
jgi:hypothetical protein